MTTTNHKLFVIITLIAIALPASAATYLPAATVPDSVLHRTYDKCMTQPPKCNLPWQQCCDSVFHLIATRPLSEIRREVVVLYAVADSLARTDGAHQLRQRLLDAIDRYHSPALGSELDVMDTYLYFWPDHPDFYRGWDYFWKLVQKYDDRGDRQTKMRIMQRLLEKTCGYQADWMTTNIGKNGIPAMELVNEILDTQQRMDDRGEPFLFGAAHFYTRVGLLYYYFKLYDKALPLLWKAAATTNNFFYDRSVMTARDYLGDYYVLHGDYGRADSLYTAILYSPERVYMRPVDDLVAIGRMAAGARRNGNRSEAVRLHSVAVDRAMEFGDTWLATVSAINVARIHLEDGDTRSTRRMLDRAYECFCDGVSHSIRWEPYYELCRDYHLATGDIAGATLYIDSMKLVRQGEQDTRNLPTLFYAHEQTYEAGLALKEEQLRSERTRVVCILVVLAMSLLLSGALFSFNRKVQAKNRDLFNRIREHDELAARNDALVSLPHAEEPSDRQRELFLRLREYLLDEGNFARTALDANQLAAELSTNRNYLYEAIKTFTGKTLQVYIKDLRLEESKRLLETSEMTVESIASRCGYSSVRTFYRLFGVRYGMSPAVYRRLVREEEERVKNEKLKVNRRSTKVKSWGFANGNGYADYADLAD